MAIGERAYAGRSSVKGQSPTVQVMLLTSALFGLQFVWSVEQTYMTPYMLSIGMSKTMISLVWLAGPLSGLVAQPLFGALSDQCTSKYGRRRPFMIVGNGLVVLCLMITGYTTELVTLFSSNRERVAVRVIWVCVLSVFVLDFAINAIQAAVRALIVDTLPAEKQESGNAWAGRMIGGGHFLGYSMGFANLLRFLPFLGGSQFKIIVVLSSVSLTACVAVTCKSVEERTLVSRGMEKHSVLEVFRSLYKVLFHLSTRIKTICAIQVLAWHGWFPFLFYSSSWVGEIYIKYEADHNNASELDRVGKVARIGSLGLMVFSSVSLVSSLLTPLLVKIPSKESFWSALDPYRPTLPRLWAASHFIFALAMFLTLFVNSVLLAALTVGLAGLSWSITIWAPFSLLGEEIARSGAVGQDESSDGTYVLIHGAVNLEETAETDDMRSQFIQGDQEVARQNDNAGAILGIHNIAICIPQFIISLIASIVFALLEPGPLMDEKERANGVNAIAVVLRIGGLFSILAGFLTWKKMA